MPMEDTYGIQSRIGSIIVVERWYCCRGSPVFSDRNIHAAVPLYTGAGTEYFMMGTIADDHELEIVEEREGKGQRLWGRLRNNAGWIPMDLVEKRITQKC